MCLAIPAKVVQLEIDSNNAIVSIGGVLKTVSLALVTEVKVNDYLLVHVGFALNKIDSEQAQKTLALFAEAGVLVKELGESG